MRRFYEPSLETLDKLSIPWICSYSGGKDSSALVTWLEWLRRAGWIDAPSPRLVLSDTGVEFPFLRDLARGMMDALAESGWHCEVVVPPLGKRLYCQIFGRGLTPIHPAIRRMRWCTRATKIDPMDKYRKSLGGGLLTLTGVRWGESKVRDGKLRSSGCQAGGECGVPAPGEGLYAPIVNWTVCQIVDWLSGLVNSEVCAAVPDLLVHTAKLVDVYGVKRSVSGFGLVPPAVTAARFGCVGCPAIDSDKNFRRFMRSEPGYRHLSEIYRIWRRLRLSQNRLPPKGKMRLPGPIRMEVRRREFDNLLEVQRKSGIVLVTQEEEAFIRRCWEEGVYPRGWSAADEARPIRG